LLLVLAACGFQLRGTADVPFESVYLPSPTSGVQLDLKRQIQAGTRAKVVDNPKDAQAIMQFTQERRDKEILSLTAAGRVREFRLRYIVGFRVIDGKGGEFVPLQTINLFRDVSFNDSDVLAKESEEQMLFRDMQADMVSQIMRRLAASQQAKPAQ
jgi:LPS-assembly lipoprotein